VQARFVKQSIISLFPRKDVIEVRSGRAAFLKAGIMRIINETGLTVWYCRRQGFLALEFRARPMFAVITFIRYFEEELQYFKFISLIYYIEFFLQNGFLI